MSDANRTTFRVTGETAPKVQSANPLYQQLRVTSGSLSYQPETQVSNELDATRQVNDLILTGFSSGGEIPGEFSIKNFEAFYEGLFFDPWYRTPEIVNGASWKYGWGSAPANRITSLTATTLSFTADSVLFGNANNAAGGSFVSGHLIRLFNFSGGSQILKVTASTATSLTVAGAFPDAAPNDTARVKVVGFEGAAGDLQADTAGGNALTSTTLNFTTLGLRVGQWIKIGEGAGSFGTASNNGYARVSAISANRLSLDVVPSGWVIDAAAGVSLRVFFGDTIRNGVTSKSYTVEEQMGLSAGTRYLYHRGQQVSAMALNADTKSIITQSVTLMGMDSLPASPNRMAGAVTIPPTGGQVLNSSTAIPLFLENGTVVTSPNFVNSFSMTLDNGLRTRDAVGVLGAASIGAGRVNVTGTLNTYFGDESLYNKVINNTVTKLVVGFRDNDNSWGEFYDMPRVKYSSGAPDVTGIDTDIFIPLNFQALGDPTGVIPYTLMVSRFDYLPVA